MESKERTEEKAANLSVRQIADPDEKQRIAAFVLEALHQWFEVPESREAYIRESRGMMLFAAFADNRPAGFLCLKETGRETVELAVMGVLKEYHRHGIGKVLFMAAKEASRLRGYEFMQVKTVKMGCYDDYDDTNRFYQALGFRELEVFPEFWDADNPCQVYVLSLKDPASVRDLISRRHSYRGKYKPDRVPREHLEAILQAGLDAPSGCNKQTTSLIAVDDPAVLEKLHAVIDPPVGITAPAMICVLTRRINAYRDRCFAVQDYSAAIENMLLAIISFGYQSCWYEGHITDTDRIGDRLAAILGVPEEYELVCILPVGLPETEPSAPAKKPFGERAWFNGFPQR